MATKKNVTARGSKAPTSDREPTDGEKMMAVLRKKGPLTTEQLAAVAELSVKNAYSRLWWLQKREGLLKSTGQGKARLWQLSARGAKSMAPPAPTV